VSASPSGGDNPLLSRTGPAPLKHKRFVKPSYVGTSGQLATDFLPASDGSSSAHHLTGPRMHHQAPNAGHHLPQEAPDAFASAILELADPRSPPGRA
jgi:pimeloyl-ACP methyl ester carboxylesterase